MDYTQSFEASTSKKSSKFLHCFLGACIAALLLVALISSRGVSYSEPETLNAVGFLGTRLGAPRAAAIGTYTGFGREMTPRAIRDELQTYGIGATPLAQLAVSAIVANNRGNRMRDVSMQAAEVNSGWSLVDTQTKEKLMRVIEDAKYKSSLLAGVSAPMNYFDPLGFSTTTTTGKLLFYREVELKHGRVAMLAALGILVGENYHPLFGGDIDVPAIFAFQQTPLQNFWPAVVAAIAIPEIYSVFSFQEPGLKGDTQWTIREDHEPGNLGFDPLGLKPTDPSELKDMQTKELNNGRLAMIAAAGMIAQELATGQKLF
jgi:hypothetical protein